MFILRCSTLVLTVLSLASRNADGSETARYAHWVRLSNHVLEKLLGPNVANCLTDIGLPQLTIDESTLIFQCNGGKQSTDGDSESNVDSCLVAEGTSRYPQATGLSIVAALKTTRRSSPKSGVSWETTWKNHCTNVASTVSQTAAEWSDILLDVEFRKQKDYEMQSIPLRYDERSQVGEDDTDSNEDAIGDDEDDTSNSDDDTSDDQLVLANSTPKNQNKKRSRQPRADDSSVERPRKKQRSKHEEVFSSCSEDKISESNSCLPKMVSRPPPPEQMAIYAAERLSSSVAVRYSIDFLVIGERPRT